ncbi:MAG TPA: hypothetical protein VK625_16790 [Flavitalea sp.]|nr:hypothetical protein [Flavitalea sp.]
MRYTTSALKKAIPLYQDKFQVKKKSGKVLSDSREEKHEYYTRRIHELQQELQKLNFLEHPLRIIEICKQIQTLRNEISKYK